MARYLRLCQLWVDATSSAAQILNGMLQQSRKIGLITESNFKVTDPVSVVPVIAIGEPVKNPDVANERMKIVHEALAEQDVGLGELQVWSVDVEGRVASRGLGGL